jgi:hypothetical protein
VRLPQGSSPILFFLISLECKKFLELIFLSTFMKKAISLSDKKITGLEKHPVIIQQVVLDIYKPFIQVIDKYFHWKGNKNIASENFLNKRQFDVINIADEAVFAYNLMLKMRKEKDNKKKQELYESYRLRLSNPLEFGILILKLDKLVYPPKGMHHKILTSKNPKSLHPNIVSEYLEECDELIINKLKNYFPLLAYGRNNVPVFYSFCWRNFMKAAIDSIKLSGKKSPLSS